MCIRDRYLAYRETKHDVMKQQRSLMALETLKARPLASFVRNQLINGSYLPIIGDNLAKQMGALGQDKRSDLMGLLLLISPPGYGKTTLMGIHCQSIGFEFHENQLPFIGA